jgi:hypothetical protein
MGLDTKTYWLTDRQSQWDFDFDEESVVVSRSWEAMNQGHETIMERSSTEFSWELSSVRAAVKRRLYM